LTSAVSNSLGSAYRSGTSAAQSTCTRIVSPKVRLSMEPNSCIRGWGTTARGRSGCRRAKVSSLRVRPEPLSTARSALSMISCKSGRSDSSASSSCRLPETTVSRLLKSCATPPVSWPTASSLCACASCSSVRLRCTAEVSRPAIDCRKLIFPSSKLPGAAASASRNPSVSCRTKSGTRAMSWNPALERSARMASEGPSRNISDVITACSRVSRVPRMESALAKMEVSVRAVGSESPVEARMRNVRWRQSVARMAAAGNSSAVAVNSRIRRIASS